MKTRKELAEMTTLQLREECKELKISGYGKMDKTKMVEAIIEKQKSKDEPNPSDEEIYTDRHLTPVAEGQRANFRIQSRWFPGTITKFKTIEGDQFIFGLLDGKDLSKMFHSTDVELLVGLQKGTADVPADLKSESEDLPKSAPVVTNKPKSEPKVSPNVETTDGGFRKTKYDDILKTYDRMGINFDDKVNFEPSKKSPDAGQKLEGIVKSFVWDPQDGMPYFVVEVDTNGTKKRYFKSIKSLTKIEQ